MSRDHAAAYEQQDRGSRRARYPTSTPGTTRNVSPSVLGLVALHDPLVVTSPTIMDWFGYDIGFAGRAWVGPCSARSSSAGWLAVPRGGAAEIRGRRPGMMLLISMAITVATCVLATSLHWLDLEFWWERRRLCDRVARPLA